MRDTCATRLNSACFPSHAAYLSLVSSESVRIGAAEINMQRRVDVQQLDERIERPWVRKMGLPSFGSVSCLHKSSTMSSRSGLVMAL